MKPEPFDEISHAAPSPDRVAAIGKLLTGSLSPAKPLPSGATLICIAFAAFVVVAVLLGIWAGPRGFYRMDLAQNATAIFPVLSAGLLLSVCLVRETVPGSPRTVPLAAAIAFPFLAIGTAVAILFPRYSMDRFVERGVGCLWLGTLSALIGAVLVAIAIVRWGYLARPWRATVAAGALAGTLGAAVLTLHCPIFNAAHILVWHLGPLAIAIALAATAKTWGQVTRFPVSGQVRRGTES